MPILDLNEIKDRLSYLPNLLRFKNQYLGKDITYVQLSKIAKGITTNPNYKTLLTLNKALKKYEEDTLENSKKVSPANYDISIKNLRAELIRAEKEAHKLKLETKLELAKQKLQYRQENKKKKEMELRLKQHERLKKQRERQELLEYRKKWREQNKYSLTLDIDELKSDNKNTK